VNTYYESGAASPMLTITTESFNSFDMMRVFPRIGFLTRMIGVNIAITITNSNLQWKTKITSALQLYDFPIQYVSPPSISPAMSLVPTMKPSMPSSIRIVFDMIGVTSQLVMDIAEVWFYNNGVKLSQSLFTFSGTTSPTCCGVDKANDGDLKTYYESGAAAPTLIITTDGVNTFDLMRVFSVTGLESRMFGVNIAVYKSPSNLEWKTKITTGVAVYNLQLQFVSPPSISPAMSLVPTVKPSIQSSIRIVFDMKGVTTDVVMNIAEVWFYSKGVKLSQSLFTFSGTTSPACCGVDKANDGDVNTYYESGAAAPTLTITTDALNSFDIMRVFPNVQSRMVGVNIAITVSNSNLQWKTTLTSRQSVYNLVIELASPPAMSLAVTEPQSAFAPKTKRASELLNHNIPAMMLSNPMPTAALSTTESTNPSHVNVPAINTMSDLTLDFYSTSTQDSVSCRDQDGGIKEDNSWSNYIWHSRYGKSKDGNEVGYSK